MDSLQNCYQQIIFVDAFNLHDYICVLRFSYASGIQRDQLLRKNRQTVPDVTSLAKEEQYENLLSPSDVKFMEARCSGNSEDMHYTVKICQCKPSDGKNNLPSLAEVEKSDAGGNLDSRRRATDDEVVVYANDMQLCSSCRALEQQRSVQPRSLEVLDGHEYENIAHIFRIPARAASGNCLDMSEGRRKQDAEETASQHSSLVTSPVGQITSSASVDTALGQTVCKCNDDNLVSYRFVRNSVELESPGNNTVGVSDVSAEHVCRENQRSEKTSNHGAHCSGPSGEVSLLNDDLLKHSQRSPRSVSMPIDIVSMRHLPPDQRVGQSLVRGVSTATFGPSQELQLACSECIVLPSAETRAMRKRAYRVGLNLFNW